MFIDFLGLVCIAILSVIFLCISIVFLFIFCLLVMACYYVVIDVCKGQEQSERSMGDELYQKATSDISVEIK